MSHNDISKSVIKPLHAEDPFAFEEMEFSFVQSPAVDTAPLAEEVAALDNATWHMDFVCTKCAEKNGVDFDAAPEKGFVTVCSSCSKQVHVIRESCACRAKRKSFEIACATCGKLLDSQAHCSSCGELFPDYFVAIDPVAARQKTRSESFSRAWSAIKDLNISFNPSFNRSTPDHTVGQYTPTRAVSESTGTSRASTRALVIRVVLLVAAIALVVAGKFAYEEYKSGQAYADNYIKALYCIKSGVDMNLKTCSAAKAEWEAANVSGLKFSPRISNKDEAKSVKLRGEIDKYLRTINNPPKKFLQTNGNLLEVHKIYLASEALVQAEQGSLKGLTNSIEDINKKMSVASQNLKSTLPDSLKTELANAKLKYRGFKDF